jgi:NADH dehydrogenase (ubiquinone) 1 alpha subcomplex subunit 5
MWVTRVLQLAVKKTTTGIVGLPVNPNARQDLIKLYQKTLQEIKVENSVI